MTYYDHIKRNFPLRRRFSIIVEIKNSSENILSLNISPERLQARRITCTTSQIIKSSSSVQCSCTHKLYPKIIDLFPFACCLPVGSFRRFRSVLHEEEEDEEEEEGHVLGEVEVQLPLMTVLTAEREEYQNG